MKLIIAEKPSMAAEIAKQLPQPHKRNDGYIETGEGIVTWLFGHILRQASPDEYDSKYKAWVAADLPIIPETWKLCVTESCKKQFKVIKELVGKADSIVHAGDPDREGQLLVDEVLEFLKNKKPVQRLLLNALDEKSVQKALADLRENKDFFNLKQSALARARADWLIGMNLSRAYTLAAKKAGHSLTFPIGRVKTPTLSLVVRREQEIENFKPLSFYGLKVQFKHLKGEFETTWQPQKDFEGLDSDGRILNSQIVEDIKRKLDAAAVNAAGKIASFETTKGTEPQPLPLSLSALQILASKRFGYDPQTVLDIAQSLYEKKLTSYPRSDCDFLPESQLSDAADIIDNLAHSTNGDIQTWARGADLKIKSRAWNDKKITAHHAIIPTTQICDLQKITPDESNIYYLVSQAYLVQFYPPHTFNQTKLTVDYCAEVFTASGRVIVKNGWKDMYGKTIDEKEEDEKEENQSLPAMKEGDNADYVTSQLVTKTTKKPSRFTTGTLVQAMKEIHKYVKNQDLKKQLKDVSGIGTEATRATIIKDLLEKEFLLEKKKSLYPSEAAFLLVGSLPEDLTYPDATAIWENVFNLMITGKVKLDDFMNNQTKFVTDLCKKADAIQLKAAAVQDHLKCPQCGKVLKQRKGAKGLFWGCSGYPDCKANFKDEKNKPVL